MFVTTVTSTYAIDARTGKQRWVRTIKPKTQMIGTPVRGVAYADGRLFAERWMVMCSRSMRRLAR